MANNDKAIPSFSDQTFKVMEIDGKEEIFVSDIHSDQWNDGQTEFGVKKINQLANTTNEVVEKTTKLETTSKEQANSIIELEKINKEQTDSINELEKVNKDQTDSITELEKISKGQTGSINELIKKIQELEEDSKKLPYYEGEYKWMPYSTTSMPKGWTKVDITKGHTLVSGNDEWDTSGIVGSHNHIFSYRTILPNGPENLRAIPNNGHELGLTYETDSTRQNGLDESYENLAAGIHATLWQYDPNGTFTKLRAEAIKSQKLKEKLEKEKEIKENK